MEGGYAHTTLPRGPHLMSEKPTAQKRNVHDFLRFVVDKKASDLHVKAGGPPYVRISGRLMKTDFPAMSSSDCERAAMDLMDESQAKGFKERGETDFAYSEQGLGRFRVNVFRQRGSVAIAARRVLPGSPGFDTLGLPPIRQSARGRAEGTRAGHGPDVLRQDDHNGRDDQSHQRNASVPHPHDRGSRSRSCTPTVRRS